MISTHLNLSRIRWDLSRLNPDAFLNHCFRGSRQIHPELFHHPEVWLEIGSGSGDFFVHSAKLFPEVRMIPIEICRERATTLLSRASRLGYSNLLPLRGSAIPQLIHGTPSRSLSRIYILYPCPWPKNSQRKKRWYLHPLMSVLIDRLKLGGVIIWASDQKNYIDETRYVCEEVYQLRGVAHGQLSPNEFNLCGNFPRGRTKFERTFFDEGKPCYEFIGEKTT